MKKFNVEVTRTDEYNVQIDENVWTEKALKNWSETFFDVDLEGLAENLAYMIMRLGTYEFYEGYGRVKFVDSQGNIRPQYKADYSGELTDDDYCKGVIVEVISEDFEYEFETQEIEESLV